MLAGRHRTHLAHVVGLEVELGSRGRDAEKVVLVVQRGSADLAIVQDAVPQEGLGVRAVALDGSVGVARLKSTSSPGWPFGRWWYDPQSRPCGLTIGLEGVPCRINSVNQAGCASKRANSPGSEA
jgi:hypothetical protein